MVRGGIEGRLEVLEARARGRLPEAPERGEAGERMREHLDRLAAVRRGNLPDEEEAEVWATHAIIERRMAGIRGEGVR